MDAGEKPGEEIHRGLWEEAVKMKASEGKTLLNKEVGGAVVQTHL